MFKQVDHAINGRGEVAVFVPPFEARPTSWRPEGRTGIWLGIPDRIDATISISPSALDAAKTTGRVLVVEVGDDESFEEWVEMTA